MIRTGDRLVQVMAADGPAAVRVQRASRKGDRFILRQTADGKQVPIRVSPVTKAGERGILARTADGFDALVKLDFADLDFGRPRFYIKLVNYHKIIDAQINIWNGTPKMWRTINEDYEQPFKEAGAFWAANTENMVPQSFELWSPWFSGADNFYFAPASGGFSTPRNNIVSSHYPGARDSTTHGHIILQHPFHVRGTWDSGYMYDDFRARMLSHNIETGIFRLKLTLRIIHIILGSWGFNSRIVTATFNTEWEGKLGESLNCVQTDDPEFASSSWLQNVNEFNVSVSGVILDAAPPRSLSVPSDEDHVDGSTYMFRRGTGDGPWSVNIRADNSSNGIATQIESHETDYGSMDHFVHHATRNLKLNGSFGPDTSQKILYTAYKDAHQWSDGKIYSGQRVATVQRLSDWPYPDIPGGTVFPVGTETFNLILHVDGWVHPDSPYPILYAIYRRMNTGLDGSIFGLDYGKWQWYDFDDVANGGSVTDIPLSSPHYETLVFLGSQPPGLGTVSNPKFKLHIYTREPS